MEICEDDKECYRMFFEDLEPFSIKLEKNELLNFNSRDNFA